MKILINGVPQNYTGKIVDGLEILNRKIIDFYLKFATANSFNL